MWFLLPLGRTDEAFHQMRIVEADPVSPRIQDVLG
jgi:hypothetical protein